MADDFIAPSTSDFGQPGRHPQTKFAVLLILLAALIILSASFGVVASHRANSSSFGEQEMLQADLMMKMYYFQSRLQSWANSTSPASSSPQAFQAEVSRDMAVALYQSAVSQQASYESLRRLVVIAPAVERPAAIKRYSHISDIEIEGRGGISARDAETAMWRAIYVSPGKLSAGDMARYVAKIRAMSLGWYERLALADLYAKAGMTKNADSERSQAYESATRMVMTLVGIALLMIIMGFVGLVFLIIYIISKSRGRPGAMNDIVSLPLAQKSIASEVLLEIFVVCIVIHIGMHFLASDLVKHAIRAMHVSVELKSVVTAALGYCLWGFLTLAYTIVRLRSIGLSLKSIGLSSRYPLQDIKWGIAGYMSVLPVFVIAGIMSQIIFRLVPGPSNSVDALTAYTKTALARVILFLLVSVAAPFFEELFFRGLLFNSLRSKWGVATGVVISAIVFAVLHPLPFSFLPIFVLGSGLAVTYYQRGSLLSGMVFHGLHNGLVTIFLFLLTS